MTSRFDLKTVEIKDPADLLNKLQAALRADGDFPVRAKVISDLYNLANNPNTPVNKISEVILREPSLGTRILHLVNSGYYHRGQPILTVSQAVVQVGMRTLCNLCGGLVLIHKFLPAAKRGAVFADNLKRTILTSLLTSGFSELSKNKALAERGYLAGSFYYLGYLLLGYYFPQVYETAAKRAVERGENTIQSITELLGITASELNLTILRSLQLPDYYKEMLTKAYSADPFDTESEELKSLIRALIASGKLADAIVNDQPQEQFKQLLPELVRLGGVSEGQLMPLLNGLPAIFSQHCEMIELGFLKIPDYLSTIGESPAAAEASA